MSPVMGISITKRTAFRSSTQEFQNVYYYQHPIPAIVGDANTLIDAIVDTERKLHSSAVSFVFARAWSAGGTPGQNQMIHQKSLAVNGIFATIANFDRERAYLVQWPAGLDVRGKPVFLRKWYHACGAPTGVVMTDGKLGNTDPLTSTDRSAVALIANEGRSRSTASQGFDLSSRGGRVNTGAGVCHQFLEHHQLGDQWRG